jgi:hypothetical protein
MVIVLLSMISAKPEAELDEPEEPEVDELDALAAAELEDDEPPDDEPPDETVWPIVSLDSEAIVPLTGA